MNTNPSMNLGYESPIATVLTISTEDVICTSNFTIPDWNENNDVL